MLNVLAYRARLGTVGTQLKDMQRQLDRERKSSASGPRTSA